METQTVFICGMEMTTGGMIMCTLDLTILNVMFVRVVGLVKRMHASQAELIRPSFCPFINLARVDQNLLGLMCSK